MPTYASTAPQKTALMVANIRGKDPTIESDVAKFMSEFAKYLIGAGVSSRRFERLARLGYFLAASKGARFGSKKLNQSAVAAMTGLTRVQVRQFAQRPDLVSTTSRDRLDQLIEGWLTDAAFLNSRSLPRRLRLKGRGRTFRALVRRYGGDVPPRSLLRELQRRGLVTVRNGHVSLKTSRSPCKGKYRLRLISRTLARLMENADDAGLQSSLRTINLETSYPAPSEKGRLLLHRRAEEGLKNFLSGLKEAGTSIAVSSLLQKRKNSRVARARLVLMTDEVELKS